MNKIQQLHENALAVAKRYKASEIELINILQEVGKHRVFYHMKYNSLFQYAVQAMGLSENVAYVFINVSRKASQIPKLKEEIEAGRISVSKAKVILSVLSPENQDEWLKLASTSSKRDIEREVARVTGQPPIWEQIKFTNEMKTESARIVQAAEVFVELKLGVPESLMKRLRQAQDLVSQSKQRHVNLVESLDAVVDVFIEKTDPLAKAERHKQKLMSVDSKSNATNLEQKRVLNRSSVDKALVQNRTLQDFSSEIGPNAVNNNIINSNANLKSQVPGPILFG